MTLPHPPTIAHFKTHGLDGLWVTCGHADCQDSRPFTFAALGINDDEIFPLIAERRRFSAHVAEVGR